jgi:hypothetical protein
VLNELAPWILSWADVDPALHPFDPDETPGVVADLGRTLDFPAKPAGAPADDAVIAWSHQAGRAWADQMTQLLVEQYGAWAAGWRWAHGESDVGGGPVSEWCCPRDSISTQDETLGRVAAALVEWRGWVEALAELFDRFPLDGIPAGHRRAAWECGASCLVTAVVEQTGADDAWYNHCDQVLTWFLERWRVPPQTAGPLVTEAIGGRFESWVGPPDELVDEVAWKLAETLAQLPGGGLGG